MSALFYLSAPILAVQGFFARKRARSLDEPPGPREGAIGQGPPLRLLITGDSSAAGVGTAHQDEALSGQLVSRLSERFEVTWKLVARTGNTTAETLIMLAGAEGQYDVAVTALGVNDVTRGVPMGRWMQHQAELRSVLKSRFGVKHIVVSALPPVHQFPLLPQPTRAILGRQARRFDGALSAAVARDPVAEHLPFDMDLRPSVMSSDGFHPGPKVYARWGELAAARIVTRFGP